MVLNSYPSDLYENINIYFLDFFLLTNKILNLTGEIMSNVQRNNKAKYNSRTQLQLHSEARKHIVFTINNSSNLKNIYQTHQ